jgi:hypothetical protein
MSLEIAHVLNAVNADAAAYMVDVATDLGAHQLNVKHVELVGRAAENSETLSLSGSELMDAYTSLIIRWVMDRRIRLSLQLPAAFAYYLQRRFGIDAASMTAVACAGTKEFGYVDLLGNHLPCPAMSFEENRSSGYSRLDADLDLTRHDAASVRRLPLFVDFESRRAQFAARESVFPCNVCRFNSQSSPCTAALVRGESSTEVALCKAVFERGDDAVPGLRDEIFAASSIANDTREG